jgi:hypothetical protein
MTDIDKLLVERGANYGRFQDQASISQELKCCLRNNSNWGMMEGYHQEALDMIAHKIARILNGNPDFLDSWDDIAGYAMLVSKILRGENP